MKGLPGALYAFAVTCAAFAGHQKAGAMLQARRNQSIPEGPFDLWVHVASLGEYLMAKPLLDTAQKAQLRVLVSFFSTSGAEIAKGNEAHFAFLPFDRAKAVDAFLTRVQPRQVLFIKYDLWPALVSGLQRRAIPYSVAFAQVQSASTRLKSWNFLERSMWRGAQHVFHQTSESLTLWKEANFSNGRLSGDGRFDQVGQVEAPEGIKAFTDFRPVLVAGSTWQPEEDLLLPLLMRFPELKVILAPHAISRVAALESRLPVPSIRWSQFYQTSHSAKEEARVLLVDTLGDLPALYACGNLGLVGGAFGPGLHNILEALAHGLPVACGPHVEGHWEAQHPDAPVKLLPAKAEVEDLAAWIQVRLEKPNLLASESAQAKAFIAQHRGASQQVWDVLFGD